MISTSADVMSELLKKRRKLAAVRLQFWPSAPQEIVKFLRDKLVCPADRRAISKLSPLDPGLLLPPGQPRFGQTAPRLFPIRQPARFRPRGL